MSDEPPSVKRPAWKAATIVEPDEKLSTSTSVACWLVGLVNGSALSGTSGRTPGGGGGGGAGGGGGDGGGAGGGGETTRTGGGGRRAWTNAASGAPTRSRRTSSSSVAGLRNAGAAPGAWCRRPKTVHADPRSASRRAASRPR